MDVLFHAVPDEAFAVWTPKSTVEQFSIKLPVQALMMTSRRMIVFHTSKSLTNAPSTLKREEEIAQNFV